MLIVAWTVEDAHGNHTDFWETRETMADAKAKYAEVSELENLYAASICGVLDSTDYATFALPELPEADMKVVQAFLLLPHELRTRFMVSLPFGSNENLMLALELLEKV